ncbi:MAG: O-antigen ligase family protein, partial [Actinomycetota bacterium]|nr:O-antigen ligase family protein [Actinomycetota bacterium]
PLIVVPAVVLAVALVALFVRVPAAVPVAILLAAPFRVPLDVGAQRVFLLVPLYGVLAAGAVALAVRLARAGDLRAPPRVVALPVAAFVVLASLSVLWADEFRTAGIDLVFFALPFAVLFALVFHAPLARWTLPALAAAFVGLGTVFAVVGLAQLWTKSLPLAPDIEVANAYTSYTRVTSLFSDPSIYGRHLALALVLVVVLLWAGRLGIGAGAALMAVLVAGLVVSYSQSSMLALFAAVVVVSFVAADRAVRRLLIAAAVAGAVLSLAVVAVAARDESLRRVTSGRSDLVANTAAVVADHPVLGVGIGGEERASRAEAERRGSLAKPSHTTPLTVAAELGIVGLVAYGAFLYGAGAIVLRARARDPVAGLALGGALVALVVHSLFYSGFFEDPLTWFVLALAASLVVRPPPA